MAHLIRGKLHHIDLSKLLQASMGALPQALPALKSKGKPIVPICYQSSDALVTRSYLLLVAMHLATSSEHVFFVAGSYSIDQMLQRPIQNAFARVQMSCDASFSQPFPETWQF